MYAAAAMVVHRMSVLKNQASQDDPWSTAFSRVGLIAEILRPTTRPREKAVDTGVMNEGSCEPVLATVMFSTGFWGV